MGSDTTYGVAIINHTNDNRMLSKAVIRCNDKQQAERLNHAMMDDMIRSHVVKLDYDVFGKQVWHIA